MKAIALLIPTLLVCSAIPAAAQRVDPGFNQADATHHFLLNDDGGVISLEAANPEDPMVPDAIRAHLARVTKTGIPELQRLRANITYTFEPTPDGGHLHIRTNNLNALISIHEYLRTQIDEFGTGDTGEVK